MDDNNNNINNINIYTEQSDENSSSLSNQNTQSQSQPFQTPISVPQYISQNNELASPSSLPPNYNDISNDDLVIELKRPNSNQNECVVISVENSDQYAIKPGEKFPRHSILAKCSHCNKIVDTKISYENNDCTWGCCIILFCFTCILWIIPLCLPTFKDCIHYCPNCRREIGRDII